MTFCGLPAASYLNKTELIVSGGLVVFMLIKSVFFSKATHLYSLMKGTYDIVFF